MTPTWTRAAVQQRLVEAERVIARTTDFPMRIRTTASDVPQSIKTEEERMDILRGMHERLKIEGFYDPKTGLLIKPVPLSWGRGLPPTDSIQRAEEAFWWPAMFVHDEAPRICLTTYIGFRTKRSQGFPAIVMARLRKRGLAPAYARAAYRMKDAALSAIVAGLNMARVPVVAFEDAA